jgi:sulfopyruvate decarboxylase alpha subunit
VRQVPYVPDSGHARLIELCRADRNMRAVPLTTEEEGVALLAGAWLAGDRGVLLMQSSGSGNCINMLGMIVECRFPLLMLITMRGQWGEFNPWQLPMAQATLPALNAIGTVVQSVDEAGKVEETVSAAAKLAFNTCRPVAVLISQRIVGAKEFR